MTTARLYGKQDPARLFRPTRGSATLLASFAFAFAACASNTTEQQRQHTVLRKEYAAVQLFQRGEAAAAVGDLTRAEQYFVAALNAGGDEKKIVRRLLVVCVADERYPVALERAEHYLERHPMDVDMKFATASIHIAVGNLTRATLLLQEVVRERPQWPDAHYALATVLRQQGDASERADVHDLEYLRLEPDGPLAERVRARLSKFGD